MSYELPLILQHKLLNIGLSEDTITQKINQYKTEASDYISLVLPDVTIDEKQMDILRDTYIQYKIFSMVELDEIVRDKKQFLDELVNIIKENVKAKKEELKNSTLENKKRVKGIMVF